MKTFRHSGDMGDIVYSLPAVKELGGGDVYIGINNPFTDMTKEKYEFIKPLLLNQPYIHDVHLWNGEPVDYNLDDFREYYFKNFSTLTKIYRNIAEMHLDVFYLNRNLAEQKWLYAKSHPVAPVVINRTFRYRNDNFNWRQFEGNLCVFVGSPEEHKSFCREQFNVAYQPVKDALEMAEIIQGSEVFIGNQSLAFAISEGLKKFNLLEESERFPNCRFRRASQEINKLLTMGL